MAIEAPPDKTKAFADAIAASSDETEINELAAQWILSEFDSYYSEFRTVPAIAKLAFEQRNPGLSVSISKKRLGMYSESMHRLGVNLSQAIPFSAGNERMWDKLESTYWELISKRYEADLALAYIHSVRRSILRSEWRPVAYAFGRPIQTDPLQSESVIRTFHINGCLSSQDVRDFIAVAELNGPFRDIDEDAQLCAERVNLVTGCTVSDIHIDCVEVFNAGFYRNRGVYIVARLVLSNGGTMPLIIALLNEPRGIYVDAVLHTVADAHNLFSSTLANFHVTTEYYHELAGFLHVIMPERPIGLHYTTIGFNHFGKVAVMNELKNEVLSTAEVFQTSPGFRGTVAMGFSTPSSAFNLKVIRDKPTSGYKWGTFEGVSNVLRKYSRVHDINRTGSMLDNIIYYNVKLDRNWFDEELCEELLREAPNSVSETRDGLIFKHLIVQIRMTPLPLFLQSASEEDSEAAIINLGHCIKNNAAANIFNKDLDARNYGVSRYLKVYLYDYDALENFTEVKIRTNLDRYDGEEDIPDWYFEDGYVFLPEEIESGLCLRDRRLTKILRQHHGNLMTTEYWQKIQQELMEFDVPSVQVYPDERKLRVD